MTARESARANRHVLAWLVHAYTALGLIAAAGVAVLAVRRAPGDDRSAFLLLTLATLIDASDGWLARRVDVARVLPSFDGRRLDDLIDFQTYTALPLLLIWRSEVLGPHSAAWLLAPLVASAYGFSQAEAKTSDGYFRGFPSYWNVVAFYLLFLGTSPNVSLGIILLLSVLTFVPTRYLYPSQPGGLNRLATVLGGVWGVGVVLILLEIPAQPRSWLVASLAYPAFYLVTSWGVSLHLRRRHPTGPAGRPGQPPH